jgi:hypothetical protein
MLLVWKLTPRVGTTGQVAEPGVPVHVDVDTVFEALVGSM